MKKEVVTIALSVMLVGCAGPVPKRSSELNLPPPPSKEEAMERINAYLNNTLIDPESARINCAHLTMPSWIWIGVGFDLKYGYLTICDVNAKNRFGGYTGAKRYFFRFNGGEFEYHDHVARTALLK